MARNNARQPTLREQLLRQREEVASLGRIEREAVLADTEAGRPAALDQADASALDLQTDIDLALLEMQSEMMAHIDHALDRIDAGTYGVCEDCGKAISGARLRALPAAERCRFCEETRESSREKSESFGADRHLGMPFVARHDHAL